MTRSIGGMDRARCPVCGQWKGVRLDGVMGQHGPHEARCPGSGRPVAPPRQALAARVIRTARWHYRVPLRAVRISGVLAGLVGSGRGVGRGNSFGQALAIDAIRVAELLHRVPAYDRLPLQPREAGAL